MNGTVFASARSRSSNVDLGETLRVAFDAIGSAGGHADMAGAQIPLGVIEHAMDDETVDVEAIVWDVVTDRFLEALREEHVEPDELIETPSEIVASCEDEET
jgi:nanoRNase/pAp phosphatase (c-di-AMP/oligoRNAs hydrolase)